MRLNLDVNYLPGSNSQVHLIRGFCSTDLSRAFDYIRVIAGSFLVIATVSCAPYPVKPQVSLTEEESLASDAIVLTHEPKFLLKKFSEAVHETHPNIDIVNNQDLLSSVIPVGERTLQNVLQPKIRNRMIEQLRVTHLVLIDTLYEHEGKLEGPFFIFIGAWGVGKQELEARFGATIFNLVSGLPINHITAEADATVGFAGYFFPFVVGPWAEADLNTIRGVADEVGESIVKDSRSENIRIVALAAERDQKVLAYEKLMNRAKRGDADAQYNMHWKSEEPENIQWLCRAADQEHWAAQGRLGDIYYNGWFGVNVDHIRSYMWFRLASRGDDKWAAWAERQLKTRFKGLMPAEIKQAERMADEWKPGQCEQSLTPVNI